MVPYYFGQANTGYDRNDVSEIAFSRSTLEISENHRRVAINSFRSPVNINDVEVVSSGNCPGRICPGGSVRGKVSGEGKCPGRGNCPEGNCLFPWMDSINHLDNH